MDLKNFSEQFIEGYLIEDLSSMSKCTLEDGKNYGAVGYPMIISTLAGMELLGGLLTPLGKPFNTKGMRANFLNYWDNYFSVEFPQYKGLGDIFYSLIRNGIAHFFIASHGIVVNKFAGPAILIDKLKKEIYVNPNELFGCFRESYINKVKPIFLGNDPATKLTVAEIELRISMISKEYNKGSNSSFKNLSNVDISILTTDYWRQIKWAPQSTSNLKTAKKIKKLNPKLSSNTPVQAIVTTSIPQTSTPLNNPYVS